MEGRIGGSDGLRDGGLAHPRNPTSDPDRGSPIVGVLVDHRGLEGAGTEAEGAMNGFDNIVQRSKNLHYEKI